VSLLDWYIEKWCRHSKLLLFTAHGVDPDDALSMMQLACGLIIMGRNTFLRGHHDSGYALSYTAGGWRNPSFLTHLTEQKLGAPRGEAVRDGYVYTREFEFARVMLDTEGACRIEWLRDDGSRSHLWERVKYVSHIAPLSVLLGSDDFNGANTESSYMSRAIAAPRNERMWAWGEMSRATANTLDVVDTSLFLSDGSRGDGVDTLGFLKSTKADGIFAMYRVDNAEATWTFDVTGYRDLAVEMEWAVMGNMPDMGITIDAAGNDGVFQTVFQVGYTFAGTARYAMEDGREEVGDRSSPHS